jgi:hypothetical protein
VGCRRRRVGGGDGGDSRLESGEGMAEREGRREVVVWDQREGGRGAGDGGGAVRRGEATGAEVFTYQVCSPLYSF